MKRMEIEYSIETGNLKIFLLENERLSFGEEHLEWLYAFKTQKNYLFNFS